MTFKLGFLWAHRILGWAIALGALLAATFDYQSPWPSFFSRDSMLLYVVFGLYSEAQFQWLTLLDKYRLLKARTESLEGSK